VLGYWDRTKSERAIVSPVDGVVELLEYQVRDHESSAFLADPSPFSTSPIERVGWPRLQRRGFGLPQGQSWDRLGGPTSPLEQIVLLGHRRVIWAVTDDCAIVLAVLCTHDQGLMDASRRRAQSIGYRPRSRKVGR